MVCRLVEHQEIDIAAHQNAQAQPALLPSGEHRHGLEHVLAPESESRQPVPCGLMVAAGLPQHGLHHIPLGIVKAHQLRQIGVLHGRSLPDPSRVGGLLSGDTLEQRGFSGAVVSHQGDAFSRLDKQFHIRKQHPVPVAFRHLGKPEDLVPEELLLPEPHRELFLLGGAFGFLQALYPFLHGEGPLMELVVAHEGPKMQIVRRFLKMSDLLLILLVLLERLFVAAALLLNVKAVIAVVKHGLAVHDLHDALRHGVQEPAVMGNGQHRALKAQQIILQPFRGAHVQMVGRLVQQQDVGILKDESGQVYPGLLTARQRVKQLFPHGGRDVQPVGHLGAADLGVVAPQHLEPVHQVVVLAEDGAVVGHAHQLFQLPHPLLHGVQARVRRGKHVLHRIPFGITRDLGHQPQALAAGDVYVAPVLGDLAGHQPEKRCLSRPVAPENTHALAVLHLKGQPVENILFDLKGLGQVSNGNVDHDA